MVWGSCRPAKPGHTRDLMHQLVVVGTLLLTLAAPPVPTRTDEVVDTLHGVKVPDPYRWLEKSDSDEVKSWTQKQNAHMRKLLDEVPDRKRIYDRLWQLYEIGTLGVPVIKGEGKRRRYFFTRRTGKQNQPVLYMRQGAQDQEATRRIACWWTSTSCPRTAPARSTGGSPPRTAPTWPTASPATATRSRS